VKPFSHYKTGKSSWTTHSFFSRSADIHFAPDPFIIFL